MRLVALVDKPRGITSFDCVERVADRFGVDKAGHTGTLDPNVTGLMVIALGESRKAMPVLMGMDKEYEGVMLLHGDAKSGYLKECVKKYTGTITQTPPVRSRVARRPRKRKVYSFNILDKKKREVGFRVKCEAGTYIRKLVHDLGECIGTGAHMKELRRISVGPFSVEESKKIDRIKKMDLLTLESVLERIGVEKVTVENSSVEEIRNGVPVDLGEKPKNGVFGIFDKKGKIIALGSVTGSRIKADRVFNQ